MYGTETVKWRTILKTAHILDIDVKNIYESMRRKAERKNRRIKYLNQQRSVCMLWARNPNICPGHQTEAIYAFRYNIVTTDCNVVISLHSVLNG